MLLSQGEGDLHTSIYLLIYVLYLFSSNVHLLVSLLLNLNNDYKENGNARTQNQHKNVVMI